MPQVYHQHLRLLLSPTSYALYFNHEEYGAVIFRVKYLYDLTYDLDD